MKWEKLTIEEYNKRIELAKEDIATGNVFTQEEVEAMFEERSRRRTE